MPVATSLRILRQLSIVIKRFKFEELETAVIPIFPEISWNDIRLELIKQHERFNVKNALRFIENAITTAKLRERDLNDRLLTLEAVDISRHSSRRIWYGHMLKGPEVPSIILKTRIIQNNILEICQTFNMDMDVKVAIHNCIIYVLFKEKPKKRKVRRNVAPIFFVLFPGQKHFFCSKKNVQKDLMKVIAHTLGFTTSRQIKLMGRDLTSLTKLILAKKRGTLNKENILKPAEYKEAAPLVKDTGVDYCQQAQRINYVEKCFGKDPPTLEVLVVNGADEVWKHEDVIEKLPDVHMQSGWEFLSRDIAAFITKLAEKRVITTPMPDYLSNLMILGKNVIKFKRD